MNKQGKIGENGEICIKTPEKYNNKNNNKK